MWSRSLRRPLPKPCRAHACVKPPGFSHFARSLQATGIPNTAEDDGHATTWPVGKDEPHALPNSKLRSDAPHDDTGFAAKGSDDGEWIDLTLSKAARASAGLDRLALRVGTPGRGPASLAQRIQVARDLDRHIQQSPAPGLRNLAVAARAVEKTLRLGQRLSFRVRNNKSNVHCKILPSSKCAIDVSLQLPHHALRALPVQRARIRIFASYNEEEAAPSDATVVPLEKDLTYIERTAYMVMNRVGNVKTSEKPEAFAKTVAESLLRILRFRTPDLDIVRIAFDASPPRERTMIIVKAHWRGTLGGVPAECDRLSHPIELAVKEVSMTPLLAEQDHVHAQEQPGKPVDDPADLKIHNGDPSHEGMPSCGTGSKLVLANDHRDVRAASKKIQSESLRRFGMATYRFVLRWPAALGPVLSRRSPDFCFQAAERAIADAPGHDLAALSLAAQNLQRSLPLSPHVVLQVIDTMELSAYETRLTFWADERVHRKSLWTFSVVGISFSPVPIANSESEKTFEIDVKLGFTGAPTASLSTHDRLDRQCADTILAMKELLAPVLERGAHDSWAQLADKCAEALFEMRPPLIGCPAIHDVSISLFTRSERGHKVRHATTGGFQCHKPAMIALGSNVGERVENIEVACKRIDADPDMKVLATSVLYETQAMYVEEQAAFVNGMCSVRTLLSPTQLLDRLQQIENDLGRVKLVDKGPRNIDLDIATFGGLCVDSERLSIPHKLLLEREFVLRPFCDISKRHRHPRTRRGMGDHLHELTGGKSTMYPLTPLAPGCEPLRPLEPTRRTLIMSILNVTPDSFSDGGSNEPTNLDALRETITAQISAGASIIDIGGQSSRPNAPDVTAEEEIARILPAIEVIKAMPDARHIAISIDTYRASVAEAAINAGAHIINDISAGLLDAEMLPTIARLGCTYVMMHMRGTPASMQSAENTSYPWGLIPTIRSELSARLRAAEQAGIRRWRIILDPGVGFAKTAEQNAELLRCFGRLRTSPGLKNFPWLVGSSRKGFIGVFTGAEDPKDRVAGTAATVTAAVAGGAEIVRVHDVLEMTRVVKMADAMYRSATSGPAADEKVENGEQQKFSSAEHDEEMYDDEAAEGGKEGGDDEGRK